MNFLKKTATDFLGKYAIKDRLIFTPKYEKSIWLHGASLGECKMLVTLAKHLKNDFQNLPPLILTTQKAEAINYLKEISTGIADVFIAPAPINFAVKNFINQVNPKLLILGENELWPSYLKAFDKISEVNLGKKNVALISGRFYKAAPFINYAAMGFAAMQTTADMGRFAKATKGNVPCFVDGDWKLLDFALNKNFTVNNFQKNIDVAFLSFHKEELGAFLKISAVAISKSKSAVLIPRRLSEVNIFRNALEEQGLAVVDYPLVKKGAVTIVSRFGAVKEVLIKSHAAVVGGSFDRHLGIHDFWEPLELGVKTFVGKFNRGHQEMVNTLMTKGVLFPLKNIDEIFSEFNPTKIENILAEEKQKIKESYKLLVEFLKGCLK